MKRDAILAAIIEIGIVPVVRTESADGAIRAIDAIHRGGIRAAEITMTVPGAIRALEKVADKFGDQIVLGAGTVLDPETARACMLAGRAVPGDAESEPGDHRNGEALFEGDHSRRADTHRGGDCLAGGRRRDQGFPVQRGGRREIHQGAASAISADRNDSDRRSESGNGRRFSDGRRVRGGGGRGIDRHRQHSRWTL